MEILLSVVAVVGSVLSLALVALYYMNKSVKQADL
jgi:hypothetical protein